MAKAMAAVSITAIQIRMAIVIFEPTIPISKPRHLFPKPSFWATKFSKFF